MSLQIYNAVRQVPPEAKKEITGGRLKGMTDINPMWRIKTLTEQFGPCGIGWYYDIKREWIEKCIVEEKSTGFKYEALVANVEIDLFYKWAGEWSKPVTGIGGSMLETLEKGGLYVNDECYKSALTDAISVACKALGMGADVYWDKDTTKYNDKKKENFNNAELSNGNELATASEKKVFYDMCDLLQVDYKVIAKEAGAKSMSTMTKEQHGKALIALKKLQEKK